MATSLRVSQAIVLEAPEQLTLREVQVVSPRDGDCVVEILYTGISTGTERLLWAGTMPEFPGLGYPLVPGYESVGEITWAGPESGRQLGERVFVPGASCYREVRALFGGAASAIVVPGSRVVPAPTSDASSVLLALAATAYHALRYDNPQPPDLIVGHGVLGRLLARITLALGNPAPNVWDIAAQRLGGAEGYTALGPEDDERRDYRSIVDCSGARGILDKLIGRLARGGEITLAGFYQEPLAFTFPPAFMREARMRVAAEWRPEDLTAVGELVADGRLSLDDLITHRQAVSRANAAYRTAFEDASCLKMILDWRELQ